MQESTITVPPVIEKPKVVYSSGPVRNVPKKAEQQEVKSDLPPASTQASSDHSVTMESEAVAAGIRTEIAPGMELNVPMEEVETEHMGFTAEPPEVAVDGEKMNRKERRAKNKFVRTAAGQVWEDATLAEWNPGEVNIQSGGWQ